jgi:polar amino acid transport system substrate-binding protein
VKQKEESMKVRIIFTLLLSLIVSAQAQDLLSQIQEEGVINVAFSNEVPFGYLDDDGNPAGEAPDTLQAVLSQMGLDDVEVNAQVVEWGSLIPGLKAGRFDMVAAGMYITPTRCQEIAFSDPSYTLGEGLLVPEGNPEALTGYTNFIENPDLRMAIVAGTVEEGYALAMGVSEDSMVIFPDMTAAAQAVRTGRADAFAGTDLTVQEFSNNMPGVQAANPFEDPIDADGNIVRGYGGFGVAQANESFLEDFNGALSAIKGSEAHVAILERHGFGVANVPADSATAQALCGG